MKHLKDNSDPKVVDIYKMYADRAAAFRSMMALIIPFVIFAGNVLIDKKGEYYYILATMIAGAALIFGAFVRYLMYRLVKDYETIIDDEHRRIFNLLPLDSFMSREKYLDGNSENEDFKTFIDVIAVVAALTIVGLIVAPFLF